MTITDSRADANILVVGGAVAVDVVLVLPPPLLAGDFDDQRFRAGPGSNRSAGCNARVQQAEQHEHRHAQGGRHAHEQVPFRRTRVVAGRPAAYRKCQRAQHHHEHRRADPEHQPPEPLDAGSLDARGVELALDRRPATSKTISI